MKLIASSMLTLVLLTGCATLTPTQKRVVAVGAAVLVVGAIAAHSDGSRKSAFPIGPQPTCTTQRDGSCR